MKKRATALAALLVVSAFAAQTAFAAVKVPGRSRTYFNDYGKILDAGVRQEMEALLKDFRKRHKKIEIVVTVMPELDGMKMSTFLHELAFKWRRLWPWPNESRVHFVVAIKERQMRIGVSHTLEAVLTEQLTRDIIDKVIVPEFEKENYTEGIRKATLRIVEILEPVQNPATAYVLSTDE